MKKLAGEEVERLTMRDVHEIKEARSASAIEALPQELFTKSFNLPNGNDSHYAKVDPHEWLHRFVGRLWETFEELGRSGALDLKSNKQSRCTVSDARQLLSEIQEALNGERAAA